MSDHITVHFRRLVEEEVEEFITACKAFGSKHLDNLAIMVIRAFEAEYSFIYEGISRNKPDTNEELRSLTQPIVDILTKIEEFRSGNKHLQDYGNHLSTVAESIIALNWITLPRAPAQFVRDMKEAGDYFGNRVLTANKGNELHATWINKWNAVLTTLEEYVKRHHPCGFVWNYAGTYNRPAEFYLPIATPPPPPPPPSFDFGDASNPPVPGDPNAFLDKQTLAKQLLMQDINQGVDIIRNLKPVKQTTRRPFTISTAQLDGSHHGARARTAPAIPADAPAQRVAAPTPSHPPVFLAEGKKWRVEYQKNAQSLELNPTDKSESLAMYKCENSSLQTKAKMNAVTIDNCKRCVVILQHIISSVELIRCERVEVHCMGSCPNVTLDNCDSVQVFLSDSSTNCEVISSKSTSTNVCRVTEDGDYVEFPVPEQIRSVFVNNKLQSSVVEHRM